MVYWDYYSRIITAIQIYKKNKAFGRPIAFAGGAWITERLRAGQSIQL
ncbi:MAG: hypothetical protein ACLR56_14420 [Oscillospiraceae bacterium]